MPLPDSFFSRPFAHRALHGPGRPENSTEAIAAAIAAGYGIEVDVQLSADAQAMVFHDYGLARLTGVSGTVQTSTAAQLTGHGLLGGASGAPSLPQVLDQVAGRVPLVVEIKDQDGAMGPNVGPLEAQVAQALAAYEGPVAVMSFNPHAVAEMARIAPQIPRGLVSDDYSDEDWPTIPRARRAELRRIPDFDRVGASFISHNQSQLSSPAVAALKARDVPILCWTVRSPEQEAEARKIADQITFEGYAA